ncbi:unnamed protein product [Hymenolepis diminuta]|uniref:Eukaryotic translation initiation factor 3 subunit A n=1 Tax=Hymenolepis diminuta TaxID=6216 RepID=A0A0R3STS7_HYMDI|nr:unnamed protein product [Hymenolepis diminuta]
MPPVYYLKPETVYHKARDLIDVDKKNSAFDILYDMLSNRRARSWQKSLEEPMFLFVDLCVHLRRNLKFKRMIHQYRNISIQESPQSLDEVLKRYFSLIHEKTEEARKQSEDVVPDVEDLDVPETPESLMLNAMSADSSQSRTSHTILMPWLKFLWEGYRICLDLVRNNTKFEHVYHRIAREAFQFCVDYRRNTEFRKLGDMIRMHTSRIQNTPGALNGINLNNSDTQILHFETRLRQLDCAMQLEMYNEAFKIVEDICTINMLAKKIDRPSLMVEYYTKTADLFLRSRYYLFHAAALFKRYNIYREHKKGISVEELSSLGSTALCAAFAIPLPHARSHFSTFAGEYNQTKQKALAALLDLSTVPTRASLIADLTTNRVQNIVPSELVTLYEALEVDFHPLKLSQKIQPALQRISEREDLAMYLEPLYEVVVSKTLLQLSQVYRTLHFDELVRLCPFYDPLTLERCVVELIYNLELPMRVDHRRNAIIFDVYIDLGISQRDYSIGSFSGQTGGDQVSRQLTIFAQSLHQVAELFNLNESGTQVRDKMVKDYLQTAEEEHKAMLDRVPLIEDRKEQLELMQKERNRTIEEEEGRLENERRAKREQEEETLKKEAEQRNKRTAEEQLQMRKQKMERERLKALLNNASASSLSAAVVPEIKEADLEQCSVEAIVEKLQGDICKRRSELMDRANARARKLDHLVRACRLQEIPLLQEAAVVEAKERFELHEKAQQEIMEYSKHQHEEMLRNKDRLSRMKGDVSELKKVLKAMEQAKHRERYAEWEALRARVREERLAERRAAEEEIKRKEQERREAEERAQAEAKLREAEAAERRRKQEEEEEEKRRCKFSPNRNSELNMRSGIIAFDDISDKGEREREPQYAQAQQIQPAPQKATGNWQRRSVNPSAMPAVSVPPATSNVDAGFSRRKIQPPTDAPSAFSHQEQPSRGFQRQSFNPPATAEQGGQSASSGGGWTRRKVNLPPVPAPAAPPITNQSRVADKLSANKAPKPKQQDEDDGWQNAGRRH